MAVTLADAWWKSTQVSLTADIWEHFGFYEVAGALRQLENTHAICKTCHNKIKYFGNTTNMRNHIHRWHAELMLASGHNGKKTTDPGPAQPKMDESVRKLPSKSERAQRMTRCGGAFSRLRPWNCGTWSHLGKQLQTRLCRRCTEKQKPRWWIQWGTLAEQQSCDSWTSVATESYVWHCTQSNNYHHRHHQEHHNKNIKHLQWKDTSESECTQRSEYESNKVHKAEYKNKQLESAHTFCKYSCIQDNRMEKTVWGGPRYLHLHNVTKKCPETWNIIICSHFFFS